MLEDHIWKGEFNAIIEERTVVGRLGRHVDTVLRYKYRLLSGAG